jgi:hypothetical protein
LTLDPLKLGSISMINIALPICGTPVTSKPTTTGSRYLRLIFALCLTAIATAGCSKDEPTKDQLLSRAEAAFAAGQYDKAEQDYRMSTCRLP